MDLMLQVIVLCWISHKVCWGSRGEGEGEGAVVLFIWRLNGLTMLESPCKTSTCFSLEDRPWLCPRLLLRNGKCYSIWVNREEKRQINNEVDWTLAALLLYSSLRGLKGWYWDSLLNKSVQLLTFTAAEQFSSSVTISLICRERNNKTCAVSYRTGCPVWLRHVLFVTRVTLQHMTQGKHSCRAASSWSCLSHSQHEKRWNAFQGILWIEIASHLRVTLNFPFFILDFAWYTKV